MTLRMRVRDYFGRQTGSHVLSALQIGDTRVFFETLVKEVLGGQMGDPMHCGRLVMSEQVLTDMGIDAGTAHRYTEDAFVRLVDVVGMVLPQATFENRDGMIFTVREFDLLVSHPDLPIPPAG